MIQHKNYLLRKSKKSKSLKDIQHFKNYNNLLRNTIQNCKQSFYSNFIKNSSTRSKWKWINKTRNKKSHLPVESKIQVHAFLTHFKTSFSSCKDSQPILPTTCLNTNSIFIFEANEEEISNCFSAFKNKYTKQENDLPMFTWRLISPSVLKPITYLVNRMFSDSSFPNLFKQADIIPVFKKGDKSILGNYRPIACLHNLSKVFERIILNRINGFIEKFAILPPSQFGFRSGHSTKDAICALLLEINNNDNHNKKSCCCFLDLSKAFDTVNHHKLLNIFYSLGFRGNFYNLIKNFLENRSYRIKVGDVFSTYACIERGVPQGSILSPILYSIYVHDFASIHPNVIQYADDSTIILSYNTITDLQISLIKLGKNITKYMSAHDLKINVTKTEIMLFKEKESVELEFLNERLNSVPKAKFLGIIITPDLKFDHHIENNIIPNIRKHFSFFSYIAKFLDRHHKQFIFRAFIFPFILYATPFLLNTSNIKIKKLTITFNRALKLLFRLPFLSSTNNLPQHTGISSLSSLIRHHSFIYAYLIFKKLSPPLIIKNFITTYRNNFILKSQKRNNSIHNTIAIHWNTLPHNIKTSVSKYIFSKALTKHLSV